MMYELGPGRREKEHNIRNTKCQLQVYSHQVLHGKLVTKDEKLTRTIIPPSKISAESA
jgi:hypothetical protein